MNFGPNSKSAQNGQNHATFQSRNALFSLFSRTAVLERHVTVIQGCGINQKFVRCFVESEFPSLDSLSFLFLFDTFCASLFSWSLKAVHYWQRVLFECSQAAAIISVVISCPNSRRSSRHIPTTSTILVHCHLLHPFPIRQEHQHVDHAWLLPHKLRHWLLCTMLPDLRPISLARKIRRGVQGAEERPRQIARRNEREA